MSDTAFEDSLREAFEERGLAEAPEGTTSEEESEAETPEQPRDEQGRFAPKEKILGKFDSQEDLVKSYQELERKLGERGNEEVQRLAQEVAQLRQQQVPINSDDPMQATIAAYERGDQIALQSHFAEWREEDPFAAAAWYSDTRNQARIDQLQQQYEQRFRQVEPVLSRTTNETALQAVASRHSDFAQFAGNVSEIIANDPYLVEAYSSDDPSRKEWAFETAYEKAKLRAGDNLTEASTQAQHEQQEAARAAKADAVVASASTSPQTRETGDAKDRFKESILNADLGPFGA